MNDENKNIYISYWLLLITLLVALMIIVGGLTRLTDSGLSITKWDLVTGIIPPFSPTEWENIFSLYKKIPEFRLLNSSMTLDEFKFIFWWEYFHRLLGRIIGIFYFIPLIIFSFNKFINKKQLFQFWIIFILICFQGFTGWYMVKSGLIERIDVSHYRLALHLTLAFVIFILLLWNYIKYKNLQRVNHNKNLPSYLPILFISCILIQICTGAFVTGLDAGQIYKTWPLMNQSYFPDDSEIKNLFSSEIFETPSIVQFIHRNVAYLIFIFFLFILIKVFNNNDFMYLRKTILLVFFALLLQIFLGITTVLSGAQIIIASMHQIGSLFLVSVSLILIFKNSKIN